MPYITIVEGSADVLNDLASTLQQACSFATSVPDIASLNAWLAMYKGDVLVIGMPEKSRLPIPCSTSKTKPDIANYDASTPWLLNSSRLELIAPDGSAIPLSHDECCVLQAAATASGRLISRKTFIEAMGHNLSYYDERRLEALISRLRRKLSSRVAERFPVRAVRGQGYLFGMKLQEIASGK